MSFGTFLFGTVLISWLSAIAKLAHIPTVTITGVHQNIGSGFDTTMNDVSWFPTVYQSTMGSTYVFQLWEQPSTVGTSIYLFSPTATTSNRLMGVLPGQDVQYARNSQLHLRSNMFVSGTGSEDRLQVHTLSFDALSNTYGQVSWNFNSVFSFSVRTISDSEPSNYLFYLDISSSPYFLRKWDTTQPVKDMSGAQVEPNESESMQLLGNNVVVYGSGGTTLHLLDRSSLTSTASLTGPIDPRGFAIDNQNPGVFFPVHDVSPYGVRRIVLGTTTYSQTHSIPAVAGQSSTEYASPINLGTTAYIGLIRYHETNRPFRIYAKVDLVEISTAYYVPVTFPDYSEDNCVPGVVEDGKKTMLTFALQVLVGGVYNFQSWKAILDTCMTRVGLVCTSCPAGYYVDLPGFLDNSCLLNSMGPNLATGQIVPCQDTSCEQ